MRACLLLYAVAVLVIFGLWRRADAAWEQRSKARAYRKAQKATLRQLLDLSRPVPSETHPAGRRYEPESTVIVASITDLGDDTLDLAAALGGRIECECGCSYRRHRGGWADDLLLCSGHVYQAPLIRALLSGDAS